MRGLTIGAPKEAFAHATDVIDVERALGICHEAALQHLLSPAADFFSVYYMLGFGPAIAGTAIWLGLRDPARYRRLRNTLLVSVSLAAIAFVTFPTAPPRLVSSLGISDTVGLSSHDTGSFLGIRFNPYAAVPSMHVGWSLLIAVAGFGAVRRRWARACFAVHPLLMALAVTATGNHFLFDCVGGVLVALLTLMLLRRRRRRTGAEVLVLPVDSVPAARAA